MRLLLTACLALASPAIAVAQEAPAAPGAQPTVPRHLVMFTRPGANWARLRDYSRDVLTTEHRDIYLRLTERGDIVAGGAFEGEPVLGMSVFRAGINEAVARELLRGDRLFNEGVVAFEFRMLGVQMGRFGGMAG